MPDRRGARADSSEQLFERIRKGEHERRSFRERRATPRVAATLAIETIDGQERMMQSTHDLSTFGCAIAQGRTPKKGSKLKLKLFLPDAPEAPLELAAVVLGPFDDQGGARLKFLAPPADAVKRLHRFLK
jgi:hypothetical protein